MREKNKCVLFVVVFCTCDLRFVENYIDPVNPSEKNPHFLLEREIERERERERDRERQRERECVFVCVCVCVFQNSNQNNRSRSNTTIKKVLNVIFHK